MKKKNPFHRYLLADPLALAAACVISLLFVNSTQQYLNTSKRNANCSKNQTLVYLNIPDNPSPQDRPDAWGFGKFKTTHPEQKNNSSLPVTFFTHRDYSLRLKGCFYEQSAPLVWLPSIPIAHRKLII